MRAALLVLLGFTGLLSCSGAPKAGNPCDPADQVACESTRAVLACVNRTWASVPCEGLMGCVENMVSVSCDVSLATPGQKCPPWAEGTRACANAPPSVVQCGGGTWQTLNVCSGGCTSATGQPECVANTGGGARIRRCGELPQTLDSGRLQPLYARRGGSSHQGRRIGPRAALGGRHGDDAPGRAGCVDGRRAAGPGDR